MKKYKTLATVRLFSGSVVLNANQAERRADCLKKRKRGVFEVVKPVEFKAGEIIGFDEVPKPYGPLLEALEPSEKKTAAEMAGNDPEDTTDG